MFVCIAVVCFFLVVCGRALVLLGGLFCVLEKFMSRFFIRSLLWLGGDFVSIPDRACRAQRLYAVRAAFSWIGGPEVGGEGVLCCVVRLIEVGWHWGGGREGVGGVGQAGLARFLAWRQKGVKVCGHLTVRIVVRLLGVVRLAGVPVGGALKD